MVDWKKFKWWSEFQNIFGLAGDKPIRCLEWQQGPVASASGNQAYNSVDWACIVKSRSISLSLTHQWVLGFEKACDIGFWVFEMF